MDADERFRKEAISNFKHKWRLVVLKRRQEVADVAGPQLFSGRFSDVDIGILDETMRIFSGKGYSRNQTEDGFFISRNTLEIPPFKIGSLLFQIALKQYWMGHFVYHSAALPFACILIFTMQQQPLFRQFFAFPAQQKRAHLQTRQTLLPICYCLMMDTTRAPSTSIVTLSPALMNGNCLSMDTLAI